MAKEKAAKGIDPARFPSKPSKGSMGRTGDWRIFRPVIDLEKCNQCKFCWSYCPEAAIQWVKGNPQVDYDYCKGCGICWTVCPQEAIEKVKEGTIE